MVHSALQLADIFLDDGKPIPGLIPVREANKNALSVSEQAAILEAKLFQEIDFVFFRRFSDGRSSQVAAYIIDNSAQRLDKKQLAGIQRHVWIRGTVPILYVDWSSRIDVLTCARGPDFWREDDQYYHYNPAKALKTAAIISDELRRLADGTFWEEPANRALADHAKAAHQLLIQAIVEADNDLDGKNNPTLRRLLLLMVLIKYLEDRRVFPNNGWFGRFHKGAKNFFEVLKGGNPEEVYSLLDLLERKFNGDVFSLHQEGRQRLTKEALTKFARLVEARTLDRQRYLWEQFSFEHLPVEIISHLYQRFVEGHGTVYTPPFLAALLLDHAMPYDKLTGKERILDPACGSGVFLVGAFRRLINLWRSQNNWQRPDVETLKEILKRSIYGIELDPSAIDLTAFSLSLAVCDALQPDVIWPDLKFDRLRDSNLFQADFFRILLDSRHGKPTALDEGFNVVIGNPPFVSELTTPGKEADHLSGQEDSDRGSVPDKQTAYLFLYQSLNVLRPDGRVCLIQPSGWLYNQQTQKFRNTIFRKHHVDTILDFTSIRNLYDADPKTIAVSAYAGEPPEEHWIDHRTFRRTVCVHERICFELDHYDRHRVSQKQAETDPYVWRANLLGGGRLINISQRFRKMRTLADYVNQQGWDYGEGFIVGKKGKRQPAPFLTGKPLLPTGAFTTHGIDETQIIEVEETHFKSAYAENRYKAPLVLIKETDCLPIAYRDKGFIAYRDKIIGIHASHSQEPELRRFYEIFKSNHDIYRFSCTLMGSQSLVGKATAILKQDIDSLPYPEDLQDLSFSFWEKALCEDVVKHMTEYVRLGQNSVLLKRAANYGDLQEYSSMFMKMLGTVYDNLQASIPIFLNGLTCQPFYFGKRPNLSWLVVEESEDELKKLIYSEESHRRIRTVRVLRFYAENVLLIVKPDRLRYWIRSTAIRDADETLLDLRRQGY